MVSFASTKGNLRPEGSFRRRASLKIGRGSASVLRTRPRISHLSLKEFVLRRQLVRSLAQVLQRAGFEVEPQRRRFVHHPQERHLGEAALVRVLAVAPAGIAMDAGEPGLLDRRGRRDLGPQGRQKRLAALVDGERVVGVFDVRPELGVVEALDRPPHALLDAADEAEQPAAQALEHAVGLEVGAEILLGSRGC